MADRRTFVIVGAGMAGAKAAEALRAEGFDGRLVLVGREPEAPYERPPLSKDYLRGESPREKALVHPASFYADHDVELLTEVSAVALDTSAQRVELDSGPALDFDRVLLATGSIPRRPPIPGADLDGVHVLRTLADADELRAAFARGGPVVLIGAGWIGCEVAASARQLGLDVTLVDQVDAPLQNVLGAEIGGWFGALHAKHDVRLHLSSGVAQVEGDGAVRAVRLTDGTRIEAQTVVLAVGVSPDVHLALSAELTVGDGLVVDDHLRTSHPGIFAAGDIASAWHPRYERHIRVEHWSAALNQGTAAGRSMLDAPEPYTRLPYFFSDQYDAGMEYTGFHGPADRLVVRGSLEEDRFQAVWLAPEGHATAGMHVNDWDAIEPIKQLVESGQVVDPALVADPRSPLDGAVART